MAQAGQENLSGLRFFGPDFHKTADKRVLKW